MNDTTTAILSGSKHPYSIRTFDWTTMMYHEQSVKFTKIRHFCGCGLLKVNGQLIVAVSGKSGWLFRVFFDSEYSKYYLKLLQRKFCCNSINMQMALYIE